MGVAEGEQMTSRRARSARTFGSELRVQRRHRGAALTRTGAIKAMALLCTLAALATGLVATPAAAAGGAGAVQDGIASLVKDIDSSHDGESGPGGFTEVGGTVLFFATTPETGRELWKTDGTAAGTSLVKDMLPGPDAFVVRRSVSAGGKLFFTFVTTGGAELWVSDGTSAGTTVVRKWIVPGPFQPPVGDLTSFGGAVYFSVDDGVHGQELWTSDGTPLGTVLVKDINLSGSSGPGSFAVLDSLLLFQANDGVAGRELWKTDGTTAGTTAVADLTPGPVGTNFWGSASQQTHTGQSDTFAVAGSRAFFIASAEDFGGPSLWRTDGTAAGTAQIPGSYRDPAELTGVGSVLYFTDENEKSQPNEIVGRGLWRSDGTVEGTVLVDNLRKEPGMHPDPRRLIDFNGRLAFFNKNSDYDEHAYSHLWISDGTSDGTVLLSTVPLAYGNRLTVAGGILYFTGLYKEYWEGVGPRFDAELWRSDGTPEGTRVAADIATGTETTTIFNDATGEYQKHKRFKSSSPSGLTAIGETLYFSADDGRHGDEFWRYDICPNGVAKNGRRCQ